MLELQLLTNVKSALDSLSGQVPQFIRFLTGLAYVAGLGMIIHGVMDMRKLGESRSMMSGSEHGITKPLLYFATGLCLIYTRSFFSTITYTMWTNTTLQSLSYNSGGLWSTVMVNDIFNLCKVFGLAAFLKGVFTLRTIDQQAQSQSTHMTKAFCYMFGGSAIFNMQAYLNVVFNTLGWGSSAG